MHEELAPAVAVVGPANSGKTTFLHLLDEALQRYPDAPLVYVVKGNPDGTGRYLFHAPELRERLRERVKGSWCQETVETVRQWVDNSRARLELVLLDFGGKHARVNDAMLERCSHFIAVAREFDDPAEERSEGMDSWVGVCRRNHLTPVALIRSCWQTGNAQIEPADHGGILRASFRADACAPGDATNQPVIDRVVEALLALRRKRSQPPYVDLRLPGDWTVSDLADLGGLAAQLDALQGSGKPTVLGGRAPVWAYCAAMHRVLDSHPTALIEVFDPKVASGLVTIPASQETTQESPLARSLTARWDRESGLLDLRVTTPDRMLPPTAFRFVASLPKPVGAPPSGPIVVSGAVPIWLHLSYSRWLRDLLPNRALGVWDARSRAAIFVTGPDALRMERRDLPREHPFKE